MAEKNLTGGASSFKHGQKLRRSLVVCQLIRVFEPLLSTARCATLSQQYDICADAPLSPRAASHAATHALRSRSAAAAVRLRRRRAARATPTRQAHRRSLAAAP